MGNAGAHGEKVEPSKRDVLELIEFIESIMYYLYELPHKIEVFNRKYDEILKQDNSEKAIK